MWGPWDGLYTFCAVLFNILICFFHFALEFQATVVVVDDNGVAFPCHANTGMEMFETNLTCQYYSDEKKKPKRSGQENYSSLFITGLF